MVLKAKLQQIRTRHEINPVRNHLAPICGEFRTWPKVGEPFVFYSGSLTPGLDVRTIMTSLIQKVSSEMEGQFKLETANSEYLLTVYGEDESRFDYH